MSKQKKALLIVNPCSGKNKSRAGTFDIVDKFSKSDYEFSIHSTKCQGDATNIVKDELEGHDLVVCCGGDGTLNETINGVIDMPKRVPIGYIPAGTTNDLASSLGLPTTIKEAADVIIDGHTNDYDIGLFNNRCFCYVASFGAFARSSYSTPQKLKNKLGHTAYVAAAIPQVFEIHPTKMRIEYDGGVIEDEFMFGAISNSLSVGGFFKLPKDKVKFNDGQFEVLLVKKVHMTSLFSILSKVRKQQYDGKQIIMFQTRKLKITAPDEAVAWTLDGEFGGNHHDVMVNVLERAVEIYSPENPMFLPKPQPAVIEEEPEKEKSENRFFKRKSKVDKDSDGGSGFSAALSFSIRTGDDEDDEDEDDSQD